MTVRRLLLIPLGKGHYRATSDRSGLEIVRSDQPLYDGARVLLAQGLPPETLLTTRHAGDTYDAWTPTSIGELAKWTVAESSPRGGLRRRRWKASPYAISPWAVTPPMRVEEPGHPLASSGQDASVGGPPPLMRAALACSGVKDSLVLVDLP